MLFFLDLRIKLKKLFVMEIKEFLYEYVYHLFFALAFLVFLIFFVGKFLIG